MDYYILIALLLLGIFLFIVALRKGPIIHSLLIFFMTAYASTFVGVIVVEEKMLKYPITLFGQYFDSSMLFEYLLFPIVNIFFHQTTIKSKMDRLIIQTAMYSGVLTSIEVLFEKYTDLIEYMTWTWFHSFVGMFLFLLIIRGSMKIIWKMNRA
ncbi:CBO0543 family protein [Litchfieldia alkalitelluris]|uniref:CBO0543 family protein n=1 Tax=Litchfieldia alkalitelluris TaxID=304268 RepID=UPI0009987E75|nr:CBO0543 family protein [Litchfieldia alkalitelluris]